MSNSTIDIVLPVYNGAAFLEKCLISVIQQKHNTWRLLISDDASTDESVEIIQKFLHDPRIQLYRNEQNKGLFENLNGLIQACEADYIKIWTQDDVMRPECLMTFLEYFEQNECIIGYCNALQIEHEQPNLMASQGDQTPVIVNPELFTDISIFHGSIVANLSCLMMRSEVFSKYGLFNSTYQVSADFEFYVRVGKTESFLHVPEALVEVRKHSEQLSIRSASAVQFANEDREIYEELFSRINTSHKLKIAKKYYREVVLSYHVNTALKLYFKNSEFAEPLFKFIASHGSMVISLYFFLKYRILKKFGLMPASIDRYKKRYNE